MAAAGVLRGAGLPAVVLLAVLLGGCGRGGGEDASRAHPALDARNPALPQVERPPPPPSPSPDPLFDATAFAGSFQGEGVTLQLRTDGRYLLRSRVEGRAIEPRSEGLWSLETGSGQLLLVPHAADEPRRRYSMPSADELVPEGGDPPLRRVGAGADAVTRPAPGPS